MYARIRVYPNAKKESFEMTDSDTFDVHVKEKAEKNIANNRVLELVAMHYNIKRGDIKRV